MSLVLGLAGDTMLGRKVAERIVEQGPHGLFGDGVLAAAHEADLLLANLECCISARGERWPDPRKPFYFRAPPAATETLQQLGVGVVTLANNHALDFGVTALEDTLTHLDEAGIAHVGAGRDVTRARRAARLEAAGTDVAIVGLTDHPQDFAAGTDDPGTAYADLRSAGLPAWTREVIDGASDHVVVVTPHWGPNMVPSPVPHVRRAAAALAETGASLVAGHSAHVFHGVGRMERDDAPALPVLYDLGDLIDDYAVDRGLRNDLGLLWLVHIDGGVATAVDAVPLTLEYCRTVRATGDDEAWIRQRLATACADLGTEVVQHDDRVRVPLR